MESEINKTTLEEPLCLMEEFEIDDQVRIIPLELDSVPSLIEVPQHLIG